MKRALLTFLAMLAVAPVGGLVYIQAAGSRLLSVQSGSMMPHIREGDLVTVKNVPVSQLAVGDVITFINPTDRRSTVTHRIVALEDQQRIITKGDANALPDQPISKKMVLGIVVASIPYAGHAIDFLRQPLGLVLVIYIPAIILMVAELRRLVSYYRSQQPYRLAGYHVRENKSSKLATGTAGIAAFFVLTVAVAVPVKAALLSNPVTLSDSSFSVNMTLPPPPPPTTCVVSSTNNTTVVISTGSNQTATSGNVNASGNTTGSSVTSGEASNTNSTAISINITNGNECNL